MTTIDYCDACNQRAETTITLPSGGTLTLCGHHTARHRHALPAGTTLTPANTTGETRPTPVPIG